MHLYFIWTWLCTIPWFPFSTAQSEKKQDMQLLLICFIAGFIISTKPKCCTVTPLSLGYNLILRYKLNTKVQRHFVVFSDKKTNMAIMSMTSKTGWYILWKPKFCPYMAEKILSFPLWASLSVTYHNHVVVYLHLRHPHSLSLHHR